MEEVRAKIFITVVYKSFEYQLFFFSLFKC